MLILAFDTTSEQGGVAVYRDAERLVTVPNQGPGNNYSVTLFQMVDHALGEPKARKALSLPGLCGVDLFAVATGPGSFTGIRVGLAAAKGWAKACNRPVKGVSVLESMVEEAQPETEWAVPVLDARRGEFFLGVFHRSSAQSSWVADGEGLVLKPEVLESYLEGLTSGGRAGRAITCVVRQQDVLACALKKTLPTSLGWRNVPGSLLDAIARLAIRAHQEGKLDTPAELDAYYVRRSDAELLFQKGHDRKGQGR